MEKHRILGEDKYYQSVYNDYTFDWMTFSEFTRVLFYFFTEMNIIYQYHN